MNFKLLVPGILNIEINFLSKEIGAHKWVDDFSDAFNNFANEILEVLDEYEKSDTVEDKSDNEEKTNSDK